MNDHKYGPLPNDRTPFMRRCRLLQSWYRVEVLGIQECGPWEIGETLVGSSLVDGTKTGANFISPAAFAYAKQRVLDSKVDRDLTIKEFRLFNNMLSSMPMCFNLFSDFRVAVHAAWGSADNVLGAIFNTAPIGHVEEVAVEMLPQPLSDYIDDKTAWDAAILYTDLQGAKGLASIETKYTDKLGGNAASKQDRKFGLANELGIFTDEGLRWYKDNGFDQVARNLLLTLAYAHKHHLAHARNYVLAPEADTEAPAAVQELKGRLACQFQDSIEYVPLETVVERGLARADEYFTSHLNRFRRRYLDFNQIAHL